MGLGWGNVVDRKASAPCIQGSAETAVDFRGQSIDQSTGWQRRDDRPIIQANHATAAFLPCWGGVGVLPSERRAVDLGHRMAHRLPLGLFMHAWSV